MADLFNSFIKVFFSSFIFLVILSLLFGNLNNLLGMVFFSSGLGGIWALIRLGVDLHDGGQGLTSSAKNKDDSTSSTELMQDAAVSNSVTSSNSNKNSSITDLIDCWDCRGKGYQSGTSMHGNLVTRDCENCSTTGKMTHADFVRYKTGG